ncbi:hypothetical protein [Sediminibacter sp. Hel_I_10]|uniref:hypothetical protein n=1 Tax=Sediminibacter sp. Hel_I_10 TaxID=1392490 RepID=UPI0018CC6C35|nr:hypothetical protein [Sediminibacter sp. Hel_I_10]
MKDQTQKKCCKGCQNGHPGENPSCKAKQMLNKLRTSQEVQKNETKLEHHEN